jgi:hypothetical protein
MGRAQALQRLRRLRTPLEQQFRRPEQKPEGPQ